MAHPHHFDFSTPNRQQTEQSRGTPRHRENIPTPEGEYSIGDFRAWHYLNEPWQNWELAFVKKCWEKYPFASAKMRNDWAWQMTHYRLRGLDVSVEGNPDFAREWCEHYDRRITTWFNNARSKSERKAPLEGTPHLQASMGERQMITATATNIPVVPLTTHSLTTLAQMAPLHENVRQYNREVVDSPKALARMQHYNT